LLRRGEDRNGEHSGGDREGAHGSLLEPFADNGEGRRDVPARDTRNAAAPFDFLASLADHRTIDLNDSIHGHG
jgi:hypothetical protein